MWECENDCLRLKREGHSNKLTFLFLPMASKHSALPLTKVSASEVPAILKKFILKGTTLGTAILKVYLEVRLCVVVLFRLT